MLYKIIHIPEVVQLVKRNRLELKQVLYRGIPGDLRVCLAYKVGVKSLA